MIRPTCCDASRYHYSPSKTYRRPVPPIVAALLLFFLVPAVQAQDVVKPLKAGRLAISFAYQFELLDEALKRSVPRYGEYVERAFTEPMSPFRDQREAVSGELINLLIAEPGIPALDQGMIRIPVALDRGLHGTRIPFIMKDSQSRLTGIRTIDDLRRFTIGQGAGWGDVKVYEHNQIRVETAPNYESLLSMLQFGRFDMFPRGVQELGKEFASYRDQYPQLAIDKHLVIKYPFPQFFYVSKTAPRLAERLLFGLREMQRDGHFDAIFNKHFAETIAELKLDQRVVIELDNPFLPPETRVTP